MICTYGMSTAERHGSRGGYAPGRQTVTRVHHRTNETHTAPRISHRFTLVKTVVVNP